MIGRGYGCKRSVPAWRARGEKMEARRAKTGAARVWFTTAVPVGASQQVRGFKKSLEPSPRLDYSEEVSYFSRISLRIFPHTVRMSPRFRRH